MLPKEERSSRTCAVGRNGRKKLLAVRNLQVGLLANRCVAEVIIIRDNTIKMSYLSKNNSRKGFSDVTSDLNPDPAKAKGLSSLPFYFDL